MRKLYACFVFALLSLTAINASAQTGAPTLARPISKEEQLKHVKDDILSKAALASDKLATVTAIFTTFIETVDAQKKTGTVSRAVMDQTRADRDAKLKAVLSAEEFQQLINIEKEANKRH